MNEYFRGVTGSPIKLHVIEDGAKTVVTMPCLSGEGNTRQPGRIGVEFEVGFQPMLLGNLFPVGTVQTTAGSELRGWGELDGPSVLVSSEDVAWSVNVPTAAWQAAMEYSK